MAWKENGGGADNPNADREETETLLENGQEGPMLVTSTPGAGGRGRDQGQTEETEQPLIIECPKKSNGAILTSASTPSSSRKETSSKEMSSRSSLVPILVTLDPSDRVSLNTGM